MMNHEETSFKKSLGATLRLERERHGWSQQEMADKIGTNQVTVSRWEKGVSTPGPYFRQKLVDLFGKSLEQLGLVDEETFVEELPLWNVPYRRNPFFTGREAVLSSLDTLFHGNGTAAVTQIQAISGLGGIGKTQIAIEYAYRYHRHYQSTLWFTASSYETLNNDLTTFVTLLHLVEQKEPDRHVVVAAVKRWLITHEHWLLILDNVSDFKMILDILPTQGTGNILITTRQQALGSIAQHIAVEKMVVDEGITFLLQRTQVLRPYASPASREHEEQLKVLAGEIVRELDGLPLALDQAAAYIEETRCGFSAYLKLYRTHRKELLLHRGRLPMEHPESVTATWSVSFQQIQQKNHAAADLLRLLVFFNSEDIPEEVITEGYTELGNTLGPVVSNPLAMNATLELLLQYSLLQRTPEKRGLNIHPLVQTVLRDEMSKEEQSLWAKRALQLLNKAFPDVAPDNWQQCQRLISHVQASAAAITRYQIFEPEAARLLHQAANYLIARASYEQAEQLLVTALSIRQHIFRPTHPDIAATLNDLGALYTTQGRYQQAAHYLQQALAIRQQHPGLKHPDTATTLYNLAILFFVQGKYIDAERDHRQALTIRRQVLPAQHPDRAKSLSGLAELYAVQNKYEEAETLYEEALSIQRCALKPNQLDLARTLNNRALLHRFKGEYEDAEKLYVQILDSQKSVLGPGVTEAQNIAHPDIAQTYYNQARLYRAQGRYEDAERSYGKARAIREEIFGLSHPQVALSYYGLAKLYNSQGDYQQAAEHCQRALDIQEHLLGGNHPDVANTLGILARSYQGLQKMQAAYDLNLRALAIREASSDIDHPHIALILNNLVEILHLWEKPLEAGPLIERALAIREKTFGPKHPYMAYTLQDKAENFSLLGDVVQAEKFFKQALSIREQSLGYKHPRTADSYQKLASLYATLGRYDEAEQLYSKALNIREKAAKRNNSALVTNLKLYASLLHTIGKGKQAQVFEERIAAIQAKHT